MPEWAATIVSAVVVGTGGYIIRILVKISGTVGRIDAKLDAHGLRLTDLERALPRSFPGSGHL